MAAGASALLLLSPRRAMARGPGAGGVARGRVTSPFGPRTRSGTTRMHQGIDIGARHGTEVRSARSGTVVDVSPDGRRSRYGNVVIVEHPDGSLSFYAHMQGFAQGIKPGVKVSAGTVIGYVGSTQLPNPPTLGPHLHFEVLKRKITTPGGRIIVHSGAPERYDPQSWLRTYGRPVSDVV